MSMSQYSDADERWDEICAQKHSWLVLGALFVGACLLVIPVGIAALCSQIGKKPVPK